MTAAPPPEVTVFLPAALLRVFPETPDRLNLRAATVDDLLDALEARWSGMRRHLADERPAVRRHINIFVDGRRADLATPLDQDGEVHILTAISGG